MYRTLLVDDDFLVRSYLKTLDSWEKCGFEIVKDVQDGEEALDVLEQEETDVLITDISMPVMDGIELIRRIREDNPNIYIIVLSCHDDFEYVKEAMQLGADEYILKNTLNEKTLSEFLVKARNQVEKRRERSQQQVHTQKLIRMGSHTLKYHFFNGVIAGTLSGDEKLSRRTEAGIKGSFQNSAVINMFMHKWQEQTGAWTPLEADQYSQQFRYNLVAEIEELLQQACDCAELVYLGTGIFCCFLDLSSRRRSSAMHQRLTEVASACFRCCQKEPYEFGIGVSNICFGEEGIRQAYQQAREMIKLSFYDNSGVLYFESGKETDDSRPPAAGHLYERIDIIKVNREREELSRLWQQALKEFKRLRTEPKTVIQWLRDLDKKAELERPEDFYNVIDRFPVLEQIGVSYAADLFDAKQIGIPEDVSGPVRAAIRFINGNYKANISLNDAAEAAGVNAAYLSYLFKQEMQVGFSNYLQECRMECARELLRTTNCKIKDVAVEAGFNDYRYFSKIFKRLNGCNPAEYRREHTS